VLYFCYSFFFLLSCFFFRGSFRFFFLFYRCFWSFSVIFPAFFFIFPAFIAFVEYFLLFFTVFRCFFAFLRVFFRVFQVISGASPSAMAPMPCCARATLASGLAGKSRHSRDSAGVRGFSAVAVAAGSGSGLSSGSGWVAVARADAACHCGHFEWRQVGNRGFFCRGFCRVFFCVGEAGKSRHSRDSAGVRGFSAVAVAAVAVRVAVAGWQWRQRMRRVIAVILSGGKLVIGGFLSGVLSSFFLRW
jgi:hypothetical protein